MKSFLNKILIVALLALIMPFFSYAAPALEEPTLTCSTPYQSDLVGKPVSFTVHVQNGNGTNYDYSWNGDDGIDAGPTLDLNSITHSYTQDDNMVINVIASSTDSSDYLTTTCSVDIYTPTSLPPYTASCNPNTNRAYVGQDITWKASVNGPLAPYSIVWTGTDFGSYTGSSIAYATSGSKTAKMVSFESRYPTDTPDHNKVLSNVACPAAINVISKEIKDPAPLSVSGSCSAVSATQYLNSTTTWNSSIVISGGAAPHQISWTDNDGDMGIGDSISKVYSTTGIKSSYLTVQDNAGQEVDLDCGSVSIIATSTDGNTGGGDTGGGDGNTGGGDGDDNTTDDNTSGSTSSGRRSSTRVNVVEETTTSTSTDQVDIDNLVAWLKNNPDLFSPVPQNTADLDLENPTASSTLANGTSSADTVASSTDSETSLAAAAASALGSASKYVWYIAGLVLLGLAGWLVFFLLKRRNKKDKIS